MCVSTSRVSVYVCVGVCICMHVCMLGQATFQFMCQQCNASKY